MDTKELDSLPENIISLEAITNPNTRMYYKFSEALRERVLDLLWDRGLNLIDDAITAQMNYKKQNCKVINFLTYKKKLDKVA